MLTDVQHQTEGVRFLRRFVEGRLVSPILLIGPEGVGKKFSILKAIKEFFCTGTHKSDCPCSSCYTVTKNSHPDIITLSSAEKDIGIDAIREVIAEAKSYPSSANIRCIIIDGADHFTVPAANAFLKTLEEPPARSRFFLIAESNHILPTIQSRCGHVRYASLPEAFVLSIVNQYEVDSVKALVYTRMAEGSVGNAIRYWGSGKLALRDQALKTLHFAVQKDIPAIFSSVDNMNQNQDLVLALKFMEQMVHDILIARIDSKRAIHVDCLNDWSDLGGKIPIVVWGRLARKIKDIQFQYRAVRLNLPFQLKTILAETF